MLVMVYGTLKKGFGNHYLLKDSEYLGPATTAGTMYSLGAFPAVSLGGEAVVHGEVYSVDATTLQRLDKLEGFPGWYNREVVDTPYGEAMIYTMQPHNALPIAEGMWRGGETCGL